MPSGPSGTSVARSIPVSQLSDISEQKMATQYPADMSKEKKAAQYPADMSKQKKAAKYPADMSKQKRLAQYPAAGAVSSVAAGAVSSLPSQPRPNAPNQEILEPPVYDPNIPDPSSRAQLEKYWINLTLNERSAQKLLWLSEGGTKVARLPGELICPYLDRPERYELTPQVLCNESLWGTRGYWELMCSGWVVVGATSERVGRKAYDGPTGLGENEESWGVCWAGSCYHVWHNARVLEIRDIPRCSTFGVYVDQPAGLIKFYIVECKQEGEEDTGKKEVKLLYKFQNPMTERIVPGIWVGMSSSCCILKKD